jgi:hypothetical protein
MVYEDTIPRAHISNKTTAIVHNINFLLRRLKGSGVVNVHAHDPRIHSARLFPLSQCGIYSTLKPHSFPQISVSIAVLRVLLTTIQSKLWLFHRALHLDVQQRSRAIF